MHNKIADILQKSVLSKNDLIILLSANKDNAEIIFNKAAEIKLNILVTTPTFVD